MTRFSEIFAQEELIYLGTVSPQTQSDFLRYESWLGENKHGSMAYLEKNKECRKDPNLVLQGVRSVICFGLSYQHEVTEKEFRIARYAKFDDYHSILRQRGERVVEKMRSAFADTQHAWRVTVDSAPLLERALANKTSAGFIGKNTCFIHPKHGSFLLLGEILTTLSLEEDAKVPQSGCGTCTLCQVECPTGALSQDYEIDSRKCLAYWTIEHRGTIPFEYWPFLRDFVFGCDICQDVCPYNAEADNVLPKSISLKSYPGLFETATLSESAYRTYFAGTPMTRAKRDGLRRNALIAMTVAGDPRLDEAMGLVGEDAAGYLKATLLQIGTYLKNGTNQTMVLHNNLETLQ